MSAEPRGAAWRHGAELRQSLSSAAARIDEIIGEAERAAEEIHSEATAEADRYAAERRAEADRLVECQLGRLQTVLDLFREQIKGLETQGAAIVLSVETAIDDAGMRGAVPGPSAVPASSPDDVAGDTPGEQASGPSQVDPPTPAEAPAALVSDLPPGVVRYGGAAADDAVETVSHDSRDGALIRATQLAIQGIDRGLIVEVLGREFDLADPEAIVGEILD